MFKSSSGSSLMCSRVSRQARTYASCASKPVVAVRFCPITFNLRGTNTSPVFKLPYRYIFAVAPLNSLYVYDTESIQPIVIVGVHYAAITDIAWSPTGNYLALSSQDGYCTLLEFENEELGSPISLSEENKAIGDANKSPLINLAFPTSNPPHLNFLHESDDYNWDCPHYHHFDRY